MKKITSIFIGILIFVGYAYADDNDFLSEKGKKTCEENGYRAVKWINDTNETVKLFNTTIDNIIPEKWPDSVLDIRLVGKNNWWDSYNELEPGESTIMAIHNPYVYWFADSDTYYWGDGDGTTLETGKTVGVWSSGYPNKILNVPSDIQFPFFHKIIPDYIGSQTTIHITSKNGIYKIHGLYINNTDEDVTINTIYNNNLNSYMSNTIEPGKRIYTRASAFDTSLQVLLYCESKIWAKDSPQNIEGESDEDYVDRVYLNFELNFQLVYSNKFIQHNLTLD